MVTSAPRMTAPLTTVAQPKSPVSQCRPTMAPTTRKPFPASMIRSVAPTVIRYCVAWPVAAEHSARWRANSGGAVTGWTRRRPTSFQSHDRIQRDPGAADGGAWGGTGGDGVVRIRRQKAGAAGAKLYGSLMAGSFGPARRGAGGALWPARRLTAGWGHPAATAMIMKMVMVAKVHSRHKRWSANAAGRAASE